MNIRPFTQNDYPSVLDIYHKSKLDELCFEKKSFTLLPLEKDEKRYTEFRESDIYVCEADGRIIGYCGLFGSEIRALYVAPEMRGKGVGMLLFEFLLSKIPGLPSLYVAKTNSPAKQLYRKYGFSIVDEFETSYNGVAVYANKMEGHAITPIVPLTGDAPPAG